jgi:hypothetical protein
MSQPSRARRQKTRHSAEVIDREVVEALRDLKLAMRALDGHVPSMIEWLSLFGGPRWRMPSSMQPPDRWRHNPGRGDSAV